MNNNSGRQEYGIYLNNSELKKSVVESRNALRSIGDTTVAESARIDNSFNKLAGGAAVLFSVASIQRFGAELINVTGKFQTFEAVLTNTLQSPAKAKASMNMLQNFASTTPFQVDALTGAFVKLANQGFVPTITEMTKLGDLASSTGKGFDQLAEAIIDAQTGEFERLKEFGIRASKDGDKVTFTFKEQQQQVDFTASSIRDYVLSLGEMKGVQGANAQISATLSGQVSNLQDNITQAINEIGQSSSGMLSGAISATSTLVEHYEVVGESLGVLIGLYGTYKAAVMTKVAIDNTISGIHLTKEANELSKLLTVEQKASISKRGLSKNSAEYAMIVKAEAMANVQATQTALTKARIEVVASNQVVVARRAEYIASKKLQTQLTVELATAKTTGNAKQIEIVQRKLSAVEVQRESASIAFQSATRDYNAKKTAVETSAKIASSAASAINIAMYNANTASTGILSAAKIKLTAITAKLNAVMMANKFALVALVIAALAYGIYKLITLQTEAEKIQKKVNKAVNDFTSETKAEQSEIDKLFGKLDSAKKGTKEYEEAKNAITSKYGQYLTGLINEKGELINVAMAYDRITKSAKEAAKARAMSSLTEDATKDWKEERESATEDLRNALEVRGLNEREVSAFIARLNRETANDGKLSAEMQKRVDSFAIVSHSGETILNGVADAVSKLNVSDRKKEKTIKLGEEALGLEFIDMGGFEKQEDGELKNNQTQLKNAYTKIANGAKQVEVTFANGFKKVFNGADTLWLELDRYNKEVDLRTQKIEDTAKKNAQGETNGEKREQITKQIAENNKKIADMRQLNAVADKDGIEELEKQNKELESSLKIYTGGDGKKESQGATKQEIEHNKSKLGADFSKSIIEQNKKFKDDEAQAVINSMADGTDKEIAQIELDYKRKSDAIAKEQQSMLDAIDKYNFDLWKTNNPDKEEYQYNGAKATEANLSGSQSTNIANAQKIALDEQTKAKERVYAEARVRQNEYLRDYGTFEEKKLAIANLYADKIANAKSKEDKDRAIKELENEQKNLIESYIKFSSDYIEKIRESNQQQADLKNSGVASATIDVIKQINAESTKELVNGFGTVSQEYLDFCNGLVGLSIEQLASKLSTLQGQLSTTDKGTADQASKDKAIKMLTAQIKTLQAQIKVQATKKDVSGSNVSFTETIELMNDVTRTINTVIDGFDNMSDEAKNTSRSILSIAAGSIGLIDGIQKVTEFGIQSMFNTTEVAGKSMSAVEKASVILTIITTAFQIAMAIMNLINPDNKKEKEIQALQKQVDGLDKSYEKLDKTLEGVYSNDAKGVILDQEKMLIQQKALIQQQQALESSKKNTDDGKMDGFSDAIDEINDKLADTKDKIIEAVTGKDVNGAIDEFASKWVDAIGSGEDKAKAMKDVVRGMVKSAVTELVKSRMSGEVKAFMEYLALAMEDGILVPAEERMLDSLQAKIEEKGNTLDKSFSKYLEEDEGRNASSKGIAQASQSSVDKLDGTVTTIQSHTYSISEQTKQLVLTNKALLEDVSFIRKQSEMLSKLERLDAIEVGISSMKSDISSMKQQGINIKR